MNLPFNTYIKINIKNYEQVIEFLYKEGFKYGGESDGINSAKSYIRRFIEVNDNVYYIIILIDKIFVTRHKVESGIIDIDGNKLIREDKLKRILNESSR